MRRLALLALLLIVWTVACDLASACLSLAFGA